MSKIASGTIPHKETGAVSFTPTAAGVYLLGAWLRPAPAKEKA